MLTSTQHQEENCLTVSQLNQQARLLVESHFGQIWVEGEISNYIAHRSGHWYFSLKDHNSQVRCAMFKGANQFVRMTIEEGMLVKCRASVSIYEGRGDFQLIVKSIQPVGDGALQQAFEQLKQKLHKEGLFKETHKQSIPQLAEHIAIISSPTGAAIRDILTTLKRRSIGQTITLYPSEVQGAQAAKQVHKQLKAIIKEKSADVILIARGGGSLEDLWAFNDEALARTIFACPIPVVSGIGHEIDFTICDFVADLRAATPTAAAELISPEPHMLKKQLQHHKRSLNQFIRHTISRYKQQLKQHLPTLRQYPQQLQQQKQLVDHLSLNLNHELTQVLHDKQKQLNQAQTRLRQLPPPIQAAQKKILYLKQKLEKLSLQIYNSHKKRFESIDKRLHSKLIQTETKHYQLKHQKQMLEKGMRSKLQLLQSSLETLDKRLQQAAPQTILNKGYSIVKDQDGQILRDSHQVTQGQPLQITLAKGHIDAQVEDLHHS